MYLHVRHGHRMPQSLRNDPLHTIPHLLAAITAIMRRNTPKPSIAHYSHSTMHVSTLGTTSSHSWMPKGIIPYIACPNSRFFNRVNDIECFRSYALLYIHFLLLFDMFHVLCVRSCHFRMCRCICLIRSFVLCPWAVFPVDIFSIFKVV
jgi:hypothetical protein